MRRFKGFIRTDKQGSDCEFEFETPDDATPARIDIEAKEWAFACVEWGYEEVTTDETV